MKKLLLLGLLTIQSLVFGSMITIMLDPAGDAKHTGRTLDDGFERGISLQCAEQLKTMLEQQFGVRVVLTRFPGETLEPLQNANFANRLNVDLYISISCYQETAVKPTLYLYYFCNDEFAAPQNELGFYPFDKAHLANQQKTKSYLALAHDILNQEPITKKISIAGPFGIPFKPLLGIKSPAFSLELGLKTKDDIKNYVPLLTDCISAIIQKIS